MTGASKTVVIDQRFCGPKTSGNGGYSAGLFAQIIDGPASVTLKAPPPLGAPIVLRPADAGGFEAVAGEQVIASMAPASVAVTPPVMPDDTGVAAAHDDFLKAEGGHHIIPYCFVCGNRREAGDGLRIFSGPAPDSPVNFSGRRWTAPRPMHCASAAA